MVETWWYCRCLNFRAFWYLDPFHPFRYYTYSIQHKGEPNNYDNSENENQLNTDNEINTAVVEANTDKEDEAKMQMLLIGRLLHPLERPIAIKFRKA
ncbi:hypothetical protein Q2T40_02190 [Winogradskyella maritima]|nr:hypothetical protein [Winogradskyella maritima]